MSSIKHYREKQSAIFCCVAFALVSTFVLMSSTLYRPASPMPFEKRVTRDLPPLDPAHLQAFGKACEDALSDHLFARNELIGLHNEFFYKVLGTASLPVWCGRNGWLFYFGQNFLDEYLGTVPYSNEQLRAMQLIFESRANALQQLNCHYIILLAPNKETIYSSKTGVPGKGSGRRLHQFVEWMRQHSFVPVVDPTQELIKESKWQQVYFTFDTHWNNNGAYIGYRQLMQPLSKWFPKLVPLALNDCNLVVLGSANDLATMLHIHADAIQCNNINTVPKRIQWTSSSRTSLSSLDSTSTNKDATLPCAVVLRDSFFHGLKSLVAQHFSRTRFLWTYDLPLTEIESYKPQVVIQEFSERALCLDGCFLPGANKHNDDL